MAKENVGPTAKDMYLSYGIEEWNEKCLVLSTEDVLEVLKDLKSGVESEIVRIVKMAFPHFAVSYLSKIKTPEMKCYLEDPAFGYKLFMLKSSVLKLFVEKLRNPNVAISDLEAIYGGLFNRREVDFVLDSKLEDLSKYLSPQNRSFFYPKRFVHLTQYIDLEEARRLGLSIAQTFERDGADGYELESKLASLNPVVRETMSRFIGLHGEESTSVANIARDLKLPYSFIKEAFDMLFPLFFRPLGEFRNKIGFDPESYNGHAMREYANRQYQICDIEVETQYILNNVLSEQDRKVLSTRKHRDLTIYLARKYLFDSDKKVMDNLGVSLKDIESSVGYHKPY